MQSWSQRLLTLTLLSLCLWSALCVFAVNCVKATPLHAQMATHEALNNGDLLRCIIDMHPNMIFDFKLVSHQFDEIVTSLDMAALLAHTTGHQPFSNMQPGPELRQLFWLAIFLKEKFCKVFMPGSTIWPVSPISIDYALNVCLNADGIDGAVRSEYCIALAHHLAKHRHFDTLAYLLQVTPDESYSFDYNCDFDNVRVPYEVARVSQSSAQTLLKNDLNVLSSILAAPVTVDIIAPLMPPQSTLNNDNVYRILDAIGESCALKFKQHEPEERAFLHSRNMSLIDLIEAFGSAFEQTLLWKSYARLLNNIRFSTASDIVLKRGLNAFFDRKGAWCMDNCQILDMLIVTVHANQYALFEIILENRRLDMKTAYKLRDAIEQNTEFKRSMSINTYKIVYGGGISLVQEARFLKLQNDAYFPPDHVLQNSCPSTRLVLAAEFCSFEEFKAIAEITQAQYYELNIAEFPELMKLDNPVPYVHVVLKKFHYFNSAIFDFWRAPVCAHYMRALLMDKRNDDSCLMELPEFKILLAPELARILLGDPALAAALAAEKSLPIRRRLFICSRIFESSSKLDGKEILRLLTILRVPIENPSFDVNSDTNSLEDRHFWFQKSWDYDDLLQRAAESDFLPCLADFMTRLDLCNRSSAMHSRVILAMSNPTHLKSFELLRLWYWRNPASFYRFVSAPVVLAFIPRSPESALEEILKNGTRHKESQRLARVYLANRVLRREFASNEELKAFRKNVLPYVEMLLSHLTFSPILTVKLN